jgi:hypothetical protein
MDYGIPFYDMDVDLERSLYVGCVHSCMHLMITEI